MLRENVISNIDKVHTTRLGKERIVNNIKIDENDIVDYLKNKIQDDKCNIFKRGKNYYCDIDDLRITLNSFNYCIITAHKRSN